VAANECTSVAGNFDDHGAALMRYGAHCLMQHEQGFTGSHWTLPSGDYLLRIAHQGDNQPNNNGTYVPTLLAVLIAITMRRYDTPHFTRWRRFVAFIKATKRHHWASNRSDIIKGTSQRRLFWLFHREKGLQLTCWPLITIGV